MSGARLTLAPVSERAAALLHELHDELLANCVPNVPAAGSIVMPPIPARLTSRACEGPHGRSLWIESADQWQYQLKLQTPWRKPDWGWEHSYQPGVWQGTEDRVDANGDRWHRAIGIFVDDGFGQLVRVGA